MIFQFYNLPGVGINKSFCSIQYKSKHKLTQIGLRKLEVDQRLYVIFWGKIYIGINRNSL
jgi:hypothetical protein